jgi:hypothetical protein
MASGHAHRTNRSNTWPHRPALHQRPNILANGAPSTHGTRLTKAELPRWSDAQTFNCSRTFRRLVPQDVAVHSCALRQPLKGIKCAVPD